MREVWKQTLKIPCFLSHLTSTPSLWRWNWYRVPKRRPTAIWRRGNTQKKIFNMYYYCHVCSVQGILFHCVVLCIVCVYMCTALLPPGVKPTAVNKFIVISFHMSSSMKCTPNAARNRRTCSQVIKCAWSEHSDGENHLTLTWNCKFSARVI